MYEGPIQELIDELARLPGVGPKSAQRLAFWLVKATPEDARAARLVSVDVSTERSWDLDRSASSRQYRSTVASRSSNASSATPKEREDSAVNSAVSHGSRYWAETSFP